MKKITALIHKRQQGFTLVELIVAVAITGFIAASLSLSISQLFSVSVADRNRMEAVKQVENALHYINRDVQMARGALIYTRVDEYGNPDAISFTETVPSPLSIYTGLDLHGLVLYWKDYEVDPLEDNLVEYSLEGTDLKRTHYTGNPPVISTVNTVASHVVSVDSSYSYDGTILTANVNADVGGYQPAPESRTLQVKPRIK
jgi:prepilin-type N-terminal cleavage/methylation domain-containing protein